MEVLPLGSTARPNHLCCTLHYLQTLRLILALSHSRRLPSSYVGARHRSRVAWETFPDACDRFKSDLAAPAAVSQGAPLTAHSGAREIPDTRSASATLSLIRRGLREAISQRSLEDKRDRGMSILCVAVHVCGLQSTVQRPRMWSRPI